ncbi:hypothetical protein BH10PSE13_BH10PSE13_00020 [soil metagenome]
MPEGYGGPDSMAELEEVLSLLDKFQGSDRAQLSDDESLPSLIEECSRFSAEAPSAAPIRTIHHLACTGGTLISKVVAALSGVVLLSEIDPLSTMELSPQEPRFAPTDILLGLRQAARPVPDHVVVDTFRASIGAMNDSLQALGHKLVLRDHAHSHFCTMIDSDARPTLREMLRGLAPLRSLATIRHPLDSYTALKLNRWKEDFSPFTLEEYCLRFQSFIQRHRDIPLVRYEDFVENPDIIFMQICEILDLPFDTSAFDMIGSIRMTGDSGRSGTTIAKRARRKLPRAIEMERQSSIYRQTCIEFGYEA